ncbi:acyl-CoA N-acyltransferase, partial [Tirmania nivea]
DIRCTAAELGYWLGEEYWSKQIATTVVKAFVEWTFGTFDQLLRLEAFVFAWNPASVRVLQKTGFVYEGTPKIVQHGKMGGVLTCSSMAASRELKAC